MEILLLEDIVGIGKKNDLLVVGDGFALNYLLPQRKALVATPTVRKRYSEQIKRRAEEREHERGLQMHMSSVLAGKSLQFTRKATKAGKLYGSVTEEDLAKALEEQFQLIIAPSTIIIQEPLKILGVFTVHIRLGTQLQALHVTVSAEKTGSGKKEKSTKTQIVAA